MRKDNARLLDILLACNDVQEFVAGASREEFMSDGKLQSALCMKLEIIGEAARTVSDEYKTTHPEIPWHDIIGLRHRIVHEYFRLDLGIIWDIVQKDIPALIAMMEPLIPPEEKA